jgi:hypothetical protein
MFDRLCPSYLAVLFPLLLLGVSSGSRSHLPVSPERKLRLGIAIKSLSSLILARTTRPRGYTFF